MMPLDYKELWRKVERLEKRDRALSAIVKLLTESDLEREFNLGWDANLAAARKILDDTENE